MSLFKSPESIRKDADDYNKHEQISITEQMLNHRGGGRMYLFFAICGIITVVTTAMASGWHNLDAIIIVSVITILFVYNSIKRFRIYRILKQYAEEKL